ncbi:MAG: hypothetical protein GY832_26325 [Chloroflexi bacterium]|nr:hypothetical protein [Chloroflexota bacterium]
MPVKATHDTVQAGQDHITMEVRIKRAREFDVRLRLVALLLRVVSWIAPLRVVVIGPESESALLLYCPHCGQGSAYAIPDDRQFFTPPCRYCNRQFLCQTDDSEAGASVVKDPTCEHGCGDVEPWGYVISADCPVHEGEL